ncbi:alpha/beta hydrolase family protein [Sphingobium lactosutens]|uniref:alpha/beta hydrolase family protein n=1 Tax=Sphingobium lactosutens TaxID=522773 RepID=UPI002118D840|nr:alpha/beta hydrolase [Sphingobium lactosutens]
MIPGIWLVGIAGSASAAPCIPGGYGTGPDAFVVIGATAPTPAVGQRYLFLDGRRGGTDDPGAPVRCVDGVATYRDADGQVRRWTRMATRETDSSFASAATRLTGQLIEPAGPADPRRPLVVLVHGSERTMAVAAIYGHMLAAQGISVFAYSKRGTGGSEGEYTQNFELLADDAAAALNHARRLAAGRFGRAGFFGGSQGGWVAPLAATRTPVDFVAVGFGLVVSPIEEDRAQLLDEARDAQLNAGAVAQVEHLSRVTAQLMRTHFAQGFEELEQVRRAIGDAPWAKRIKGEYSGDMLRMRDEDLRRIGRARFDNLEIIWDYDAEAVLRSLKAPLLWVLAQDDREAPIDATRVVLARLRAEGRPVDAYLFPQTDHGMVEYRTNADGSRTATRITDGYLKLLGDWIKGRVRGRYGQGMVLGGAH